MKNFGRIYIEITNVCNLSCSFCHKTKRQKRFMTADEFRLCLEKIKGYTDLIFLHVMGEPLLNPELCEILEIAGEYDMRTVITTNGTLLKEKAEILKNSPALYRVNISLHSYEPNRNKIDFDEYIENCVDYVQNAGNTKVCFRLWNGGGENKLNDEIHARLHKLFPDDWGKIRKGFCLKENVYLEYADKFDWPDKDDYETGENVFCYALRDQLGILADGTVIPCCLDSEGDINLGNIKEKSLEEILESDRARAIYDGFSNRKATEELCKRCKVKQHLN